MHDDAPENYVPEHPDEPYFEPNDIPELESHPHSPIRSTMVKSSSFPAVKNRRHIIVLLIPLFCLLILKQYEVSEYNKQRSLLWSAIAKKRRKKKTCSLE